MSGNNNAGCMLCNCKKYNHYFCNILERFSHEINAKVQKLSKDNPTSPRKLKNCKKDDYPGEKKALAIQVNHIYVFLSSKHNTTNVIYKAEEDINNYPLLKRILGV